MARVITVNYFCDRKAAKHPQNTVEGETLLVWQRQKEMLIQIDVCEPCQGRLTDAEAQELALLYGREPISPEEDPELVCPFGCQHGKPYKSAAGKGRHMQSAHPEWFEENKAS